MPLAQDSALIDAGLDVILGPGRDGGLFYTGQFAESVQDNAVTGRVQLAVLGRRLSSRTREPKGERDPGPRKRLARLEVGSAPTPSPRLIPAPT